MQKRYIRITAILLCVMLMLISPIRVSADSPVQLLPSGIAKDTIGAEIEAFVAQHQETTAGMALSVFDDTSVIYRNFFGYADVAGGNAVGEDTVFEWGSATKLLVWVSVMQLWEQGRLDLESDILDYLPKDFLRNLSFDKPITMLNLMNHNAGFQDTFVGMSTSREDCIQPLEGYLKDIQPRQVFAPGTVTAYSNWGVTLAGYIVERISGIPFYEYVQNNIFAPLGMEHSALNADLSDNPWVKQQRSLLECYTNQGVLIPDCMSYIIMYPAGMCTSTLADFETFAMALLDRDSGLFHDPATYDLFMEPTAYFGSTDIPLNHHGMWAISTYGVPVIGHGGNTVGCSAYLLLDLENGVGMTVMTNQSNERIYNWEMPTLIFGNYQGESLDFTGYLVSARTVFRGPLKLQQLLNTIHITPDDTKEGLCVISESNDLQTLTQPYGDFMIKTLPELILQYLPLMLWVLGLGFCLLNLIIRGICRIIRKFRHRSAKHTARKWTIAACGLQLLPLIPVMIAVSSMFSWNMWPLWQYKLVFGAFLVWTAVYGGLVIYGIRNLAKEKKADTYSVAVILSLVISIFNILYWELGAFWLL